MCIRDRARGAQKLREQVGDRRLGAVRVGVVATARDHEVVRLRRSLIANSGEDATTCLLYTSLVAGVNGLTVVAKSIQGLEVGI